MVQGDAGGLESLLRTYGPRVKGSLRLPFALAPHDHLLEDAVHDAALTMFYSARRLDADDNLAGFFYITARRRLIRALKLTRADRQLWDGAEQELAAVPPETTPEQVALSTRISDLLESLPRLEKEILALDRATDFSLSADVVAQQLGTTTRTVYSLRNRTKARLQQFLLAPKPGNATQHAGGPDPWSR